MVSVKVDAKRKKIVIEADIETATPSSSGKSYVIASTRGNLRTAELVNGKPLTVGLNCYIPKDQAGTPVPSGAE
jgi:hypothetical protein